MEIHVTIRIPEHDDHHIAERLRGDVRKLERIRDAGRAGQDPNNPGAAVSFAFSPETHMADRNDEVQVVLDAIDTVIGEVNGVVVDLGVRIQALIDQLGQSNGLTSDEVDTLIVHLQAIADTEAGLAVTLGGMAPPPAPVPAPQRLAAAATRVATLPQRLASIKAAPKLAPWRASIKSKK